MNDGVAEAVAEVDSVLTEAHEAACAACCCNLGITDAVLNVNRAVEVANVSSGIACCGVDGGVTGTAADVHRRGLIAIIDESGGEISGGVDGDVAGAARQVECAEDATHKACRFAARGPNGATNRQVLDCGGADGVRAEGHGAAGVAEQGRNTRFGLSLAAIVECDGLVIAVKRTAEVMVA